MLKESLVEKVALEKEIEYLKSYIELQKLRTNDTELIKFELKGDVSEKMIAPMLLIPFVENAFKHGSKKAETPGIEIDIEIEASVIKMNVFNFIKGKKEDSNDNRQGTGLENVKQRLDIIYKDRYQLEIKEDKDRKRFRVYLTIDLR